MLKRQKRQEDDLKWPAFTEDERGRQCWRINASLFFAQTEVNHKPSMKIIFQDSFSLPILLWYSSKRATVIHYKLMYMEMYTSFWDAIVGWRNAFANMLTASSAAFNQMCFWCDISHLSSKHSMSGRRVMPSSKIFLTLFLNFPTFSFCAAALCQTVEAMGGLRLNSRPEQQLQSKPAKLTRSPWASHMHYSNQSILDHPDTLDIWVSVFSCRHHLFLLPRFLNFFPRCSPSE